MLRRRLWRPTPFAPEGPARPDCTVPGPQSRGFLSPYTEAFSHTGEKLERRDRALPLPQGRALRALTENGQS
jgi:hypothetical protein